MEQPFVIKIPLAQQNKQVAPQSERAEIREMFKEMNHRYMVHQPSSYYAGLKRAMDIAISMTFILLVMSWLYPIIALLIKITSKGPVFFIQKRTGYKGMEFDCYKFRTMYVNNDADKKQATKNDKRITPVGKFLRMTHLDETAQFFNVLLGDMTIVGPRPHMLYHTRHYSQFIPYYHLRHEAIPGMTGMAQVKGYIGEISEERELRKRIQWDIYYLKNRSISMDISIIFQTFSQVLSKAFSFLRKK